MAEISTLQSMDKGLNSQGDDEFVFFQNLPDELVVEIFTRLSNSDAPFDTLHDLKSLCQCSTVCKRFYSLVFLVPTLNIKHPSCKTLYEYCPKILKNFKHIRSLQVKHWSCTEIHLNNQHMDLPSVFFDAAYKPQSYSLVVVSYKKFSYYQNLQVRDILMLSDAGMESGDVNLHAPTREHAFDLITLHHMLVSSIKDHNYLQMVVVTDFTNRGTFTLEKEMLVELRNCSSINLEQVQGLHRSGFLLNMDFPFGNNKSGVVLNNICFNIIEWSEKSADDPIHKADADGGILTGLPFKGSVGVLLKNYLGLLLKNYDDVLVNDNEIVLALLSTIKLDGNLL
ncbi:F-box domain-containing protein [Heracleum sosnowskyi]|uniref:F-box domain-containing protein n=1 Tax=Heracleum sosnowskyi TaxID=360622 RepID=A0AAD8NDR0_9APIA|nr:F-box domain-containing protein [Heracleum sosnowskyi]